jgi:hypothetical protein
MGVEGDQQLHEWDRPSPGRRGARRPLVFIALVAALAIVLGSVMLLRARSKDRQDSIGGPPSSLAVTWTTTGQVGGMTALVNGRLARASNCLLLVAGDQSYPVVWPYGSSWVDGDASLRLADGQVVAIGQKVSGGGGFESIDAVSATVGRDQAEQLRPCAAGVSDQIAVFNPDASLTAG